MVPFSQTVLRVDVSCDLHPFFVHKLDAGSIWLATLAHAFNYRVAVLRDGVKSALRVGAECGCFPWARHLMRGKCVYPGRDYSSVEDGCSQDEMIYGVYWIIIV